MPILLPRKRLIERFAALSRQRILDVVANGTQSAKWREKVVSAKGTVGTGIVARGRNTGRRGFIVGVRYHEVTGNGRAQHGEHLRGSFGRCGCRRRYLLDAYGGWLHDRGVLHGVGVDVVDAVVVTPADGVDLRIEVAMFVMVSRVRVPSQLVNFFTYAASRACSNIQLTSLTATRRFFICSICVGAAGWFV